MFPSIKKGWPIRTTQVFTAHWPVGEFQICAANCCSVDLIDNKNKLKFNYEVFFRQRTDTQ